MLITANQTFREWGKIFPDQAMSLAAIDRLVHHAMILEMNVDSYRRKEAPRPRREETAIAFVDDEGCREHTQLRHYSHALSKSGGSVVVERSPWLQLLTD